MTVVLTGSGLTLEEVVRVARGGEDVQLADGARERMLATRALVERAVERGDVVYGVTTGVGARKKVRVPPEEIPAFNRRLILNHRTAQGPAAPDEVVRATMVRVANALAKGTAGVRPEIAERLIAALNDGERPREPHKARLARAVGRASRQPDLCGDRGDVDDSSVAALDHSRQDGAVAVEDAVGVDPHHPPPLLVLDVHGS